MASDDARVKFTTTLNKDLLIKVRKKLLDEGKDVNQLIEELFAKWLK